MNVWGVEIYYPNMIVNIIKTPTWYTFLHTFQYTHTQRNFLTTLVRLPAPGKRCSRGSAMS
jgi:hypothetical protein